MNPSEPSDSLARTLAAWRVAPPRDPHFRPAVRARLDAAADALSWGDYARRHAGAVTGALALAIVAGAFSGHERARARTEADSARLAAAYVQSLDARAMTTP
jgi:hypothetical protein